MKHLIPHVSWERLGTHVEGSVSWGVYFHVSFVLPRRRDWGIQ